MNPDKNLNPPLDHTDKCSGCSQCATTKIYSKTDLPIGKYGCFIEKCTKAGILEVEVGWDIDHKNNHFYTLCGDHEKIAEDFYNRNMKWEEKQAEIGYEDPD